MGAFKNIFAFLKSLIGDPLKAQKDSMEGKIVDNKKANKKIDKLEGK